MPPHPSTSEGSALREPRAMQSNGFLAYALPSAARRRTPARCCTRCPAYAPAIKVPARYSAGRAKQHNHARNVKPLPPSEESGAGSARCLVRPKRPALLGKVPRGFSSIFRLLPGQEGGGQCPLPCPAREVCIAGDSAPGRGHTHQRPFVIRQCPLPLPANLSVLLTLPCPGALPLLFHPTPGRTC